MEDNKDKTIAGKPQSLSDKIREAREEAILLRETSEAYRREGVEQPAPPHKDALEAPTVVNAALGQMNNMLKVNADAAKEKSIELKEARKEADDAKTNLFTTQLEIIKDMHRSMQESQKEIAKSNSPEAAMAMVEKWESIIDRVKPHIAPESSYPPVRAGNDMQLTLQLEKMRQDHALALRKLDLEVGQSNNNFQLKMTQFTEDSNRRWQEYKDGVKFKENAYNGFSDLAASIAAGIDKERGVVSGNPDDEVIQAAVSGFKCQLCKTHVNIPEGAPSVTCPNPECSAEYKIKGGV